MSTYLYAGVSTKDGETKARFTNMPTYFDTLVKGGHTNISLLELPEPMNKTDAINYLMGLQDWRTDNEARDALNHALNVQKLKATKKEKMDDDPVALLKQISAQMATLNELFARFASISDEE